MPVGLRAGKHCASNKSAACCIISNEHLSVLQPEQAHRKHTSALDDVAENLHVRMEVSSILQQVNQRLPRLGALKGQYDASSAKMNVVAAADQKYEAISNQANCYCYQEHPYPVGEMQTACTEADKLCHKATYRE